MHRVLRHRAAEFPWWLQWACGGAMASGSTPARRPAQAARYSSRADPPLLLTITGNQCMESAWAVTHPIREHRLMQADCPAAPCRLIPLVALMTSKFPCWPKEQAEPVDSLP